MKKTISLMLVALLLVAVMAPTAFATGRGENVTVTVSVTGDAFAGLSGNLNYNADALTYVSCSSSTGTPMFNPNGGYFSWYTSENVSGTVSTISVTFTVNADAPCGSAALSVSNILVGNQDGVAVDANVSVSGVTVDHIAGEPAEEVHIEGNCTTDRCVDTVVKCAKCGEEMSRTHNTTTAAGHKWELVSSTEGVNCLTSGDDAYKCSVCGESKSNANDKFGPHAYNAYKYNDTHHWMICDHDNSHETEKQTHNFVIDLGDKLGCICGATKDKTTTPTNPTATNPGGGGDMGDITPYPVFFLMAVAAVLGTVYGFKRFAK